MCVLQVSSVEVVQAYIDRIQEVNPLLNAVVKDRSDVWLFYYIMLMNMDRTEIWNNKNAVSPTLSTPIILLHCFELWFIFNLARFSAALQEAAQVDKLIEEETGGEEVLEDRLPLLGVPLSVKESFSLQGNSFFKGQRLPLPKDTFLSVGSFEFSTQLYL